MNKGIVMELSENSIIVMNPEGRFEKLPRGTRNCEVGEEIIFTPAARRLRIPQMAIISGMAAAILVCFVLVSTLTGNVPSGQVVAYVTIDINPSVEIGIDNDEVVQDLHGLNSDGDDLISTLEFKGKSLAAVTSDILDKAEQGALARGEGDIIISSTVVEQKTVVNDEAIATKLKAQVSKHIEEAHPDQVNNYGVTAFAAPQEIRQEAKASGVSAGKYAVYLNAVDNGAKVSLDDIKTVSIHQLAKDNGGLDKLVKPDKPIDKSSLQRLVADEKSGKLSERIQQIQNEKSDRETNNDKNAKNSPTSNTKNGNNGKATPKPTATPKGDRNNNNNGNNNNKNDKNDRNDSKNETKNDGKNGRNDNKNDNDNKNNNDNKNDDRKPTPKPGRSDDDDDDDSKNGSSSKPKPTATPSAKPTLKPTSSSKPTVKPTVKPTAKPTATPKGNDRNSNFQWNWKDRGTDAKDNGNGNGNGSRD
ncbi:anti-sigma factor domain-containing protein [Paenibacillus sp. HWE-109]|uniref:anti-sigma-I factor RsgI family protein n=1 Tax=Paenibacillus sp. HWE-109 TaxID=1306526 RepID=UPI001EE0BFB2|nr:anti-sigma factor domain-containing protein [Paenibacillus sp. HWE-109]UKS24763.1 anti-sigma factor domain-containing protein [Paenibacillus sp. HWE-109]